MAILGSHGLSVHSPFTDSVDMTFPLHRADDVESLLRPYLVEAFGSSEAPGLWRLPRLVRGPLGLTTQVTKRDLPTVRLKRTYSVLCLGISGGSCETLRLLGLWERLLADLWTVEHRVTRLHATVDLPADGPASIDAVVDRSRAGGFHLGRKALNPRHSKRYDELDARGFRAGGVYLGNPKAEIRCLVYCKRNEMELHGLPDPGPLTRVEFRLSVDGITLRDVAAPGPIFWHYARDLLAAPPGVEPWGAGDTGFMLERRQERNLWDVICQRVEDWEDLRQLGLLADGLGPYGRRGLLKRIALVLGVNPRDMRQWAAGFAEAAA